MSNVIRIKCPVSGGAHDCTSPDMTCPCGWKFEVPRFCVSIEVTDGRRQLVNEQFNCDNRTGAIAALQRAIYKLERSR